MLDTTHRIPPQEVWLKNETFRIHNQFYTLLDRRGGGSFGSVWASRTANGNYSRLSFQ
jgi:hypothetical protein